MSNYKSISNGKGGINEKALRALYENPHTGQKHRVCKADLIRLYREAGVSLLGSHPSYPGEVIEWAPDGRHFVVRRENGVRIRVREVTIDEQ